VTGPLARAASLPRCAFHRWATMPRESLTTVISSPAGERTMVDHAARTIPISFVAVAGAARANQQFSARRLRPADAAAWRASLRQPYGAHGASALGTDRREVLLNRAGIRARTNQDRLGMRLLVVEDNQDLAQLVATGLKAAGFDADLVGSAGEARTALTTTRYAAAVLDLGLPDGDGLSILQEMRRREDPTPVLVLTARSGVNDRVRGL